MPASNDDIIEHNQNAEEQLKDLDKKITALTNSIEILNNDRKAYKGKIDDQRKKEKNSTGDDAETAKTEKEVAIGNLNDCEENLKSKKSELKDLEQRKKKLLKDINDGEKIKNHNRRRMKNNVDDVARICNAIKKSFVPKENIDYEQALKPESYETILKFILNTKRYDCLSSISVVLDTMKDRNDAYISVFKKVVKNEISSLMKDDDFENIYDLVNSPGISWHLVGNDIDDASFSVFSAMSDISSIKATMDRLKTILDDGNLRAGAENGAYRRCEILVSEKILRCVDYKEVDNEHNTSIDIWPKLKSSIVIKNCVDKKYTEFVTGYNDVEKMIVVLNILYGYQNPLYNQTINNIINNIQLVAEQHIDDSTDIATLNKHYDSVFGIASIQDEIYSEYITRGKAILENCEDPVDLRSEYEKFINILTSADQIDKVIPSNSVIDVKKLYAKCELDCLIGIDENPIPAISGISPDYNVRCELATLVYQRRDELGSLATLSWLSYFDSFNKSEYENNGYVRKIISALNYRAGCDCIKNGDTHKGLEFLDNVEFEDVRPDKVAALLIIAWNAYLAGDMTNTDNFINEALRVDIKFACAGRAFKWYLQNLNEKTESELDSIFQQLSANRHEIGYNLMTLTLKYISLGCYRRNIEKKMDFWEKLNDFKSEYRDDYIEFDTYYGCLIGLNHLENERYADAKRTFENIPGDVEETPFNEMIKIGIVYSNWCCDGKNSGDIKTICQDSIDSQNEQIRYMSNWIIGNVNRFDAIYAYALISYKNALRYVSDIKRYSIIMNIAESAAFLDNLREINNAIDEMEKIDANTANIFRYMQMLGNPKTVRMARDQALKIQSNNAMTMAAAKYISGKGELQISNYINAAKYFNEASAILANDRDAMYRYAGITLYARMKLNLGRAMNGSEEKLALIIPVLEDGLSAINRLRVKSVEAKSITKDLENYEEEIKAGKTVSAESKTASPSASKIGFMSVNGRNIVITDLIGVGGRYATYKAEDLVEHKQYAFRVFKEIDPKDKQNKTNRITAKMSIGFEKERDIWADISEDRPNYFINYVDSGMEPFPWFLCELATDTYENKVAGLSRIEKLAVMNCMLEALSYLHEKGYVHNDIKPANIMLVDQHWEIGDFDASFISDDPPKDYTDGTFAYQSPEHFLHQPLTFKSDIWSAGVVVYEAMTRRLPFDGLDVEYKNNVKCGNFNKGAIDGRYLPLFEKIFAVNPEVRPTAIEFLNELKSMQVKEK